MFARVKRVGSYAYLQLVRAARQAGRSRQRVLATLGRAESLQRSSLVQLQEGDKRMWFRPK